jgi:hypothetical protein
MRKPTGSIKLPDNAAFGVRPQGSAANLSRQTITLISNFAKIFTVHATCLKAPALWRYRGQ